MIRRASPLHDPSLAWAPYVPSPQAPWDAPRVAHLHRRAGFGATQAQLTRDLHDGLEPSLDRVLTGEPTGPSGQPAAEFARNVAAMEQSAARRPSLERAQMLWLYRMLLTPHPLAEVMTLAWHSHFAASQAKVLSPELMLAQNTSFRRLWNAPISQLHKETLADGAMLRWLDGLNSAKAHPNENLAREFLELFALGEGHYSESDVRETARALTGIREVGPFSNQEILDSSDLDDGPKTILGRTGPWRRDDVVRIACEQPAAATRIAWRLYRTFISDTDEPSAELLAPLADALRAPGDVDVSRGLDFLLRSALFHSDEIRAKRVKNPAVFAIGALRASNSFAPPPDLVDLEIHLTRMGQRLFFPPNVSGWPGGLDWLRGPTILARANFAAWLTGADSGLPQGHFRDVATRLGLSDLGAWHDAMSVLLCGSPAPRPAPLATDHAQVLARLLSTPEAQLG